LKTQSNIVKIDYINISEKSGKSVKSENSDMSNILDMLDMTQIYNLLKKQENVIEIGLNQQTTIFLTKIINSQIIEPNNLLIKEIHTRLIPSYQILINAVIYAINIGKINNNHTKLNPAIKPDNYNYNYEIEKGQINFRSLMTAIYVMQNIIKQTTSPILPIARGRKVIYFKEQINNLKKLSTINENDDNIIESDDISTETDDISTETDDISTKTDDNN
jgi:hypothetical protein